MNILELAIQAIEQREKCSVKVCEFGMEYIFDFYENGTLCGSKKISRDWFDTDDPFKGGYGVMILENAPYEDVPSEIADPIPFDDIDESEAE